MKALTLWQPWASLCFEVRPCHCNSGGLNGWVEDEGWSHYPHGAPPAQERVLGDGYIPCGFCNDDWDHDPAAPTLNPFGARYKGIETRSWPAPAWLIGHRLAIHASARKRKVEELRQVLGETMPLWVPEVPVSAVLGTVRLEACVPMRTTTPDTLTATPYLWVGEQQLVLYRDGVHGENVTEERPFGIYAPGRWAWLLADPEPCPTPIAAVGHQGLWNWELPES